MGADMNPGRVILAGLTLGTSEAVIHTAQAVSSVVPLPTTCCGCASIYHRSISNNCYHCEKCGSHCSHIGTIGDCYCFICKKSICL